MLLMIELVITSDTFSSIAELEGLYIEEQKLGRLLQNYSCQMETPVESIAE